MNVNDLMTKNPAFCTPQTTLLEAAKAMCDRDCGEIPVVQDAQSLKPVGVITDRDIVCRSLAQGKDPFDLKVRDCMTTPAVTVTPETSLEECCELLEDLQIRRVPVVDKDGRCCGIVSQADIARKCEPEKAGEVLKELSQAAA